MIVHPKFDPSARILLGPGPSMAHPRVMRALSAPTVGHLDPELLALYAEEQDLLRTLFQTKNEWTFALSGTGTSGMEAALVNLVEPGDEVLIAIHGYFGERLADIAVDGRPAAGHRGNVSKTREREHAAEVACAGLLTAAATHSAAHHATTHHSYYSFLLRPTSLNILLILSNDYDISFKQR